MDNINTHNNNIIELEEKIKISCNNINNLFLLYKKFIKFIKLVKIYQIIKWDLLKEEYKKIKKDIKLNKKLYNIILKNYEILYRYLSSDEIDINNNKLNKLKEYLDDNIFIMYNLQKEHKFISIKCIQFIKDNNLYRTYKINIEIENLLNEHYNKLIYLNNSNNNYKIIKKKIKQLIYNIII